MATTQGTAIIWGVSITDVTGLIRVHVACLVDVGVRHDATLCTSDLTVFCLDPNDDYGSSFNSVDVIILQRTADTTYWCATAGSTNIDASDGYSYSANFYDTDCADCINNGYGSW